MFKKLLLVFSIFAIFSANLTIADEYDVDIYEEESTVKSTKNNRTSSTTTKKTTKQYTEPKATSNEYPKIEGQILVEYITDILDKNSEKINTRDGKTNSYLYSEAMFKLRLTEEFFIDTKWYLRPVGKRVYTGQDYADNPGYIVGNNLNDDFYGKEDHIRRKFQTSTYGLGIETLNIGYRNNNLGVILGKFDPTFGSAWDRSRFHGIYGIAKPEEYKLTEKIGGAISALFPFGDLTFNIFFDDTTQLSNTAFKRRGKDKSDGGAGNTEKLNNFSLTFDSKIEDLYFNIGLRLLDVDEPGEEKEKGIVAGLEYLFDLEYGFKFLPFAEVAYFHNFDGMKGRDVYYFTMFLPLIYENWHFIASNTTRFDDEKGYSDYTSYLTQLSFGYKFDFGLMIDVAKVWERYADKADNFSTVASRKKFVGHQDSWAFMVSYMFKF